MRILLTTRHYRAHDNSFLADHALELAALGNDVCVFASADADHDPRLDSRALGSGRLHVVAPYGGSRWGRLLVLAASLVSAAIRHPLRLWQLVRAVHRRSGFSRQFLKALYADAPVLSRPADVVHIAWIDLAETCIDLLPLLDAPIVVSCQGSDLRIIPLQGERYREPIREVFERVDLVHCVSEDLREHALELGLDPSKAFVGHWGIDTSFFCPAPEQHGDDPRTPDERRSRALQVVSVGRVHWVKGYEFALQALHEVRRGGVEISYAILGKDDGALLSVLAAIHDLGLEGRVSVRGVCSRTEVLEALRSADVFLLSSLSEGVSTATLEAMAVGVPVVVTDVGGMREAVTDGVDGLVVPARDPMALANALLEFAADSARRKEMGEQGRKRVGADFDIKARARTMLEQYRRLYDERSRGRGRRSRP